MPCLRSPGRSRNVSRWITRKACTWHEAPTALSTGVSIARETLVRRGLDTFQVMVTEKLWATGQDWSPFCQGGLRHQRPRRKNTPRLCGRSPPPMPEKPTRPLTCRQGARWRATSPEPLRGGRWPPRAGPLPPAAWAPGHPGALSGSHPCGSSLRPVLERSQRWLPGLAWVSPCNSLPVGPGLRAAGGGGVGKGRALRQTPTPSGLVPRGGGN